MALKKNILPDMTDDEVGMILLSEWTGVESDLIKSTKISMDEVENAEWPDGLISYSCFLSRDKNRVLHCVQWKSPDHHLQYVENQLPERLEKLKDKIMVHDHISFGRFRLKECLNKEKKLAPELILLKMDNQDPDLMKDLKNYREYILENIDDGRLMNYVEFSGSDNGDGLNMNKDAYSLIRSFVFYNSYTG